MIIEKKKLFKWVGGKKWIKDPLIDIVNNQVEGNRKIDTYIEPCVGGLGSFLAIANTLVSRGIKNVYLNDINEVLISTFRDLQKNNRSLYDEYIRIEKEYESRIPKEFRVLSKGMLKEDIKKALKPAQLFFLEKRKEYNSIKSTASIKRSALFIFLMQHVFNGVYRENGRGELNSPYNWEPKIAVQQEKIQLFSAYKNLFEKFNLHFSSKDIFRFFEEVEVNWENTICYIDPPFMNKKNDELKYSKDQFTKDHQKQLLNEIKDRRITNLIYSNHDFDLFVDFANEMDFIAKKFYRSNRINPANAVKVAELLIYKEYYANI
tara:strand:+ start:52486 stop:53445 length:960 start_codon:yes stop_codon:yes gene_type:complete